MRAPFRAALLAAVLCLASLAAHAGTTVFQITQGFGTSFFAITNGSNQLVSAVGICDGTAAAQCAAVKPASTAAAASDPALVVSLSPNSALPAGANIIGAVSQTAGPWTQNVTQWNGVGLGSPSNYGTSPGPAAVPSPNPSAPTPPP